MPFAKPAPAAAAPAAPAFAPIPRPDHAPAAPHPPQIAPPRRAAPQNHQPHRLRAARPHARNLFPPLRPRSIGSARVSAIDTPQMKRHPGGSPHNRPEKLLHEKRPLRLRPPRDPPVRRVCLRRYLHLLRAIRSPSNPSRDAAALHCGRRPLHASRAPFRRRPHSARRHTRE